MRLHGDFETRSVLDLKQVGLYNYARHPSTDVWCFAYRFDDTEVQVWEPVDSWEDGRADFLKHIADGGIFIAHNAPFELAIWNQVMVPRYGWPELKPEQCRCTMAMALAMALPAALENLAPALGLDVEKDMAGHRLMLQMCRPRTDEPLTWWDEPEKIKRLVEYCKQDVLTECAAEDRMMQLPDDEQALWVLDYKINNTGVLIDIPAAKGALRIVAIEKERLDAEMQIVTNGGVSACTNHQQLTAWLRSRGVVTSGVAKGDVTDLLLELLPDDEPDLISGEWTGPCRQALEIRQEAAKTSNAKIGAMLRLAAPDGKVYNTKQFDAATTGRWGGRGIQTDNFPRPMPGWTPEDTEAVLDIIRKN